MCCASWNEHVRCAPLTFSLVSASGGKIVGKDGRDLGHNGYAHSGDGTVEYASLSWALSWLGPQEGITTREHASRVIEVRRTAPGGPV